MKVSDAKKDYMFYGIVILIALIFLWNTNDITSLNSSFIIGPKDWPYILIGGLLIFSFYGIARTYVISSRNKHAGNENEKKPIDLEAIINSKGFLVTTVVALFIFLLNYIGFIISSIIFLTAIFLVLGGKKILNSLIFSVITTVLFIVLFSVLLGTTLPRGVGIFKSLSYFIY